jgi:hypothetical protein
MAVYWTSVHDPFAVIFYLLALLFWLDHLETGSRLKLALTYAAFVGALLVKEVSITLPILFFLADRILVAKKVTPATLARRYLGFGVLLLIFAWIEWIVSTRSVFTQQIGFRVGEHIVEVFIHYLSLLVFPWDLDQSLRYLWLPVALLVFLYVCIKYDRRLLFLGAAAVFPALVTAPIPPHLFNPRYLYLPLMATAVGYALLLEFALSATQRWRWKVIAHTVLGAVAAFVIVAGSARITEHTENFGGFIRQIRLQFRPIYQRHTAFALDTLLYFVDMPLQTSDISGLMFLRYGSNVLVSGADRGEIGNLRAHNAAYVFYLDDQGTFREQAVDKDARVQTAPGLPAQFEKSISLEAMEIASARVKRGEAIVVLLYWKPTARIDKDYTVFAHLVNEKGETVAGTDSQPRRGLSPTSSWRANRLVADGIVVPIPEEIPSATTYRLEIGWYYLPTLERLSVMDERGMPLTDKIIVEPFHIE